MQIFSSPEIIQDKKVMTYWQQFVSTGKVEHYVRAFDAAAQHRQNKEIESQR